MTAETSLIWKNRSWIRNTCESIIKIDWMLISSALDIKIIKRIWYQFNYTGVTRGGKCGILPSLETPNVHYSTINFSWKKILSASESVLYYSVEKSACAHVWLSLKTAHQRWLSNCKCKNWRPVQSIKLVCGQLVICPFRNPRVSGSSPANVGKLVVFKYPH